MYHEPVLGAIGLCFHRLRRIYAALQAYGSIVDRLRVKFERELADDEPIFHEYLKGQVSIFDLQ